MQFFNSGLNKIEFANIGQMNYYLINTLGDAINRGSSDDAAERRFWQTNLLLNYIKI
jgi:hypothetical protein